MVCFNDTWWKENVESHTGLEKFHYGPMSFANDLELLYCGARADGDLILNPQAGGSRSRALFRRSASSHFSNQTEAAERDEPVQQTAGGTTGIPEQGRQRQRIPPSTEVLSEGIQLMANELKDKKPS